MTWFLVDDSFAFHRKAHRAGNQALGLWVRAGSYCCQQLTDGVVEFDMIPELGGRQRDAERLVQVVLWRPHPLGYIFHKWPEKLTRAYIEAQRERNRVRMHNARTPDAQDAHNASTKNARVPSRSEPNQTEPLSEPIVRVLRSRGARSPQAVWDKASESEREDIRREARHLAAVPETCTEHNLQQPCRGCAADVKGASA